MKKLTLIFALALFSCEAPPGKREPIKLDDDEITVFNIDGCEYIRIGIGQRSWGSHKGNCSNPIHKRLDK